MTKLFISHSTGDDAFVRALRATLADHGQPGWIDSRELRGGDPLWPEIRAAIEAASAFLVVVSPLALQSEAVSEELTFAIEQQKKRGRVAFPVIPLLLDGTRLGAFRLLIGEVPKYLEARSGPGGLEAVLDDLLVALGRRLPTEAAPFPQPRAEPLEELILELSDLRLEHRDGIRRPTARARLIHVPATPGRNPVHSLQAWRLVAPMGPIEADDLRWYLEQYAIWPSTVDAVRRRAQRIESDLQRWGRLLYDAALPAGPCAQVLQAWARIEARADRRFSIQVDTSVEAGVPDAEIEAAKEAATLLLGLPWELMHDSRRYLFQGANPVRVRRRLPATEGFDVPVVDPPIRILLVTARPEDDACGYIDHRVSALPLVEATESLPGLVKLHVLDPPTLPALRNELDRARDLGDPYQVIHFDGHGVYDLRVGLGGLCFESEDDIEKLQKRRHRVVHTDTLGPLLRDHRIPLVFLEACQSAQAERASESVASELLKVGVASVVAMSHSVLVETARKFVDVFYDTLAAGGRVGDAMLAGQRLLKDEPVRGRLFDGEPLRLEDWFVPVLFQEKDDPQLFRHAASKQTREDFAARLAARLGALPTAPSIGFVGRSRELLALQRLLRRDPYAVVRGQGGEGKTTLAVEFARWMVRSHQIERCAFVSVETHSHVNAVVDTLGRQLIGEDYSFAIHPDREQALHPIERELRERATLLVIDNMESVLPPPHLAERMPEALILDVGETATEILALCARLNASGDTRFLFTSRERLPHPFDGPRHRIELERMHAEDAVRLIERILHEDDGEAGASSGAEREAIEDLAEAVQGHARTLALLAPSLRARGVAATRASLINLMADMDRRFPGDRERSVFASVELSLQRLTPENRERVRVLGVFHGTVDLDMLHHMMGWDEQTIVAFAVDLLATGLATLDPYNHLTLNAALCPYLSSQLADDERASLRARWAIEMRNYIAFLYRQQSHESSLPALLKRLELPNILALLSIVRRDESPDEIIELCSMLHGLFEKLERPQLLAGLTRARDAAAAALGAGWNHARFQTERIRIDDAIKMRKIKEALAGAHRILECARAAGERAYDGADYDLASALLLLARAMQLDGGSEQALPLLEEAQERYAAVEARKPGCGAERMASVCTTEMAGCLRDLGRYEAAEKLYRAAIEDARNRGDERSLAVNNGQLGTVLMLMGNTEEALLAFDRTRRHFEDLGEPAMLAVAWHQIGNACVTAGKPDDAEKAYRESLKIEVARGDVSGQAATLGQLGNLYIERSGRTEEAIVFFKQAADLSTQIGDRLGESRHRSNLAIALYGLDRLADAREEALRALRHSAALGHVVAPWKTWDVLAEIERQDGNADASAEARARALACFLSYRRDGGENRSHGARLAQFTLAAISQGEIGMLQSAVQESVVNHGEHLDSPFLDALRSILDGRREPELADEPRLHYQDAAELLLLIETLAAEGH